MGKSTRTRRRSRVLLSEAEAPELPLDGRNPRTEPPAPLVESTPIEDSHNSQPHPKPRRFQVQDVVTIGVSVLSLLFSAFSLALSYTSYERSQVEQLAVSIFPRSSNESVNLLELTSEPGTAYLLVYWDCLLVNIGDRPVAVVHYDVGYQALDGRTRMGGVPVSFLDDSDNELQLPLSLNPSESSLLRVQVPLKLSTSAYSVLREFYRDETISSLTQVQFALTLAEIDLYGNPLTVVQTPTGTTYIHEAARNAERFSFKFVTGRGATFETTASVNNSAGRGVLGR